MQLFIKLYKLIYTAGVRYFMNARYLIRSLLFTLSGLNPKDAALVTAGPFTAGGSDI